MATTRVRRHVDVTEAERELNRLADGPGEEGWLRFEMVLATLFVSTQAAVHVITGSLKATGRVNSRHVGGTWRGSISYGGAFNPELPPPAPGPPQKVDYAIYEQARGFGHDFMAAVDHADQRFIQSMLNWFEG